MDAMDGDVTSLVNETLFETYKPAAPKICAVIWTGPSTNPVVSTVVANVPSEQ